MVLELGTEHICVGSERTLVGLIYRYYVPVILTDYRGVGLLTYWTLSNVPLFILAAPMLYILFQSGFWTRSSDTNIDNNIVYRIAIPQIILAALALISYHVQIVTRLASGYPVWYWWLASLIIDDDTASILGRKFHLTNILTRWMVLYAIVQGGLFASFLPPA